MDGSCKIFDVTPATTVGALLADINGRLDLGATHSFALYQVGAHMLYT